MGCGFIRPLGKTPMPNPSCCPAKGYVGIYAMTKRLEACHSSGFIAFSRPNASSLYQDKVGGRGHRAGRTSPPRCPRHEDKLNPPNHVAVFDCPASVNSTLRWPHKLHIYPAFLQTQAGWMLLPCDRPHGRPVWVVPEDARSGLYLGRGPGVLFVGARNDSAS